LEVLLVLQHDYLRTVRALLDDLEDKSSIQTDAAAEAIVAALVDGNEFYISAMGHGNEGDFLHRAGGLVASQPFSFNFNTRDRIEGIKRERERHEPYDTGLETARVAVRSSHMREGDCLITGSVSGRSSAPISLAIAAGELGVTVIGITSVEYSSRVASTHPSGQRLMDVCDIVVDNCVPYGDAGLDVTGLEERIIPMSGVATITTCWMIQAQVVEKLLARGLQPSYYLSLNRPEGSDFNRQMREQFNRQGF
jgi:uncharacterized phosphosugar-binding protein